MAFRFPNQIPESIDKGTWTQRLGHEIRLWMQAIEDGMAGLQGTPDTPSEVQAGVAADASDSQAAAPSNHVHSIETAAPSVKVSYDQPPDEGAGSALMRASARLSLEDGLVPGDILQWNGTVWVSVPPPSAAGGGQPGFDGEDGNDGIPGAPGAPGATGSPGATGPAGIGFPGQDGEDGIDGLPGPQGPRGDTGPMGTTGPAGIGFPGQDGEDGLDGLQGPRGLAWASAERGRRRAARLFGAAQRPRAAGCSFPIIYP